MSKETLKPEHKLDVQDADDGANLGAIAAPETAKQALRPNNMAALALAGAVMVAGATTAYGGIITGSSTEPIDGPGHDLNADGFIDFDFTLLVGIHVQGLNGAGFLPGITASQNISSALTFLSGTYSFPINVGTSDYFYMGIQLVDFGGPYYSAPNAVQNGWARIHLATYPDVTVDFAFDNMGNSIHAFDTTSTPIPEPSTLAMLAMGATAAFGYHRLRRRKQQAEAENQNTENSNED